MQHFAIDVNEGDEIGRRADGDSLFHSYFVREDYGVSKGELSVALKEVNLMD